MRGLSIVTTAILLAACQGNAGEASRFEMPGTTAPLAHRDSSSGKITHVVIVIQENRSFNNLFYGYPGATTSAYGYDSHGSKIALKPVTLATTWDLQHNAQGFIKACNGTGTIPGTDCRMNGFNRQSWTCGVGTEPQCPNKNPPYSYVPHAETKPYFDMANQYVLADEMYASDFDTSSFMSHQYIIAGVNPESSVDYPDGVWGCPGGPPDQIKVLGANRQFPSGYEEPCWDPTTLGDELDASGVSWAYYASPVKGYGTLDCGGSPRGDASKGRGGIWSAYQAIKHICYGPDWSKNVVSPQTQFLSDVQSGNLRAVSWVTPTYANSDHGGSGSKTGPSWVASIVNAIGKSQYWDSTAIVIFWDDSGGWFDPQAPDYVDNDGLGFRLPLLVISAYAKHGYVSHVHYEHGSILRFVEDQFGLARLGASDTRANSLQPDCFDFTQPPRKFKKIKAAYGQLYFANQPLDARPPDTE
jgi:phospholipase C